MSDVDDLRTGKLDPMSRRPWLSENGKSWITVKSGGMLMSQPSPIQAKLTKEQWIEADTVVCRIFRERAPLTCHLMKQSLLDMRGEGLSKTVLETEEMTDGETVSSITGLPMPVYHLDALPLPFTHCDFNAVPTAFIDACAAAARRVAESVERTLLNGWDGRGAEPKPDEKGYLNKLRLSGLINCGKPVRFGGSIGVLDAIRLLYKRKFYGPYVIVTDADANTHDEREAAKPNLLALDGVQDVIATPALKPDEMVIAQCTPDVVRIVRGMDVTLMQWDDGFKIACIIVPQVRSDFYGNVGVAVRRVK